MSAEQSTISASTSDANQELLSPAPVPSEQTTNISSEDVAMAHNLAENPNAKPASKFKLKFKAALATKGRPRNRSKQLASFNKTRHDRKENDGKQRKASTAKRKKRKVSDILSDMTTLNSEEEELSGSELLEDDQRESLNLPQFDSSVQFNVPVEHPIVQPVVDNHSADISTASGSAFARCFTEMLENDDYCY